MGELTDWRITDLGVPMADLAQQFTSNVNLVLRSYVRQITLLFYISVFLSLYFCQSGVRRPHIVYLTLEYHADVIEELI